MVRIDADWLNDDRTQEVIRALTDAGHQALAVGGCVRNTLLDKPVTDIDIATSAPPAETVRVAEAAGMKTIPTGEPHGTITVVCRELPFEVTTFRRDVETDGRRAVVAFTDQLEEDARRRDFTMNALYAEADGTIRDPLGGLVDLEARRLRFIDNAQERIREDYLRSLRFFRFHAQYGDPAAGLNPDALDAIARNIDGLATLPSERIGAEMRKLLSAADPAPALAAMMPTGVLAAVLPGATPEAIAPLVHLEQGARRPPSFVRRLVALGGEKPRKRLRLTKKEANARRLLKALLANTASLSEVSYRYGADVGWDIALLRGAVSGMTLADDTADVIANTSSMKFPISAVDLMPTFTGQALGDTLVRIEKAWVDSGFQLSRDELLTLAISQG